MELSHTYAEDSGLWFVTLEPEGYHCGLIDSLLEEGQQVVLNMRMEILEINPLGQAIVWIPDMQQRQSPRLAAVQLTSLCQAEAILAQAAGHMALIEMRFTVLSKLSAHEYGAVTDAPEGTLVVENARLEADVLELLG